MMTYVSSGSGQKITVRYGFHNHELAKDLMGHDIPGLLKPHEKQF